MTSLALGTVQFGLPYGIANRSGQVSQAMAEEILKRAAASGISTIDTAVAYGESENCLGKVGMTGYRVITKLPALPLDERDVVGWIHRQVTESLRRLRISQLEAILLHRPADLYGVNGKAYREGLAQIKRDSLTRALGVSVYNPGELERVLKVWRPDIVQCPVNVLDRRLVRSGWLRALAADGIRMHARSVFLQGLLLMHSDRRPQFFDPWSGLLDRWCHWCEEHEVAPLDAALAFVMAQTELECVVVGVDSVAHLEEVLRVPISSTPKPPEDLFSDDRNLLEPSRWSLA